MNWYSGNTITGSQTTQRLQLIYHLRRDEETERERKLAIEEDKRRKKLEREERERKIEEQLAGEEEKQRALRGQLMREINSVNEEDNSVYK